MNDFQDPNYAQSRTINVYSIYDHQALAFNKPFYFAQHGQAIRAFGESVQDPQSMSNKFPEDFRLYFIGTFDEQKGELKSLNTPPQLLSCAIEFVKKPSAELASN